MADDGHYAILLQERHWIQGGNAIYAPLGHAFDDWNAFRVCQAVEIDFACYLFLIKLFHQRISLPMFKGTSASCWASKIKGLHAIALKWGDYLCN